MDFLQELQFGLEQTNNDVPDNRMSFIVSGVKRELSVYKLRRIRKKKDRYVSLWKEDSGRRDLWYYMRVCYLVDTDEIKR